jgi:hypothetical protein
MGGWMAAMKWLGVLGIPAQPVLIIAGWPELVGPINKVLGTLILQETGPPLQVENRETMGIADVPESDVPANVASEPMAPADHEARPFRDRIGIPFAEVGSEVHQGFFLTLAR